MKDKAGYLIAAGDLAEQVYLSGALKARYSSMINRIAIEYDINPAVIRGLVSWKIKKLRQPNTPTTVSRIRIEL